MPFWLAVNLFIGCVWLNSGFHGFMWQKEVRPSLLADEKSPWADDWLLPLRIFYHQGYDEALYYEYAQLIFGGPVDYDFLRIKHGAIPGFETMFDERPDAPWRMPYRDMQLEYPPLALAVMLPPALFARSLVDYGWLFAIEMSLCLVAALAIAARMLSRYESTFEARRRAVVLALIYGACFQLAFGILLVTQFDAWVSLLVISAVAAQVSGRTSLAAIMLAAATSAKVYPILLLPLFLLPYFTPSRPSRLRGRYNYSSAAMTLAVFACAIAVFNVPFWLLGGDRFLDTFRFHAERGLQADSTWGVVLVLLEKLGVVHLSATMRFGARELTGPPASLAVALSTIASVVMPLVVLAVYRRRLRQSSDPQRAAWHLLPTYALAMTAAFMLSGKVLSPQFFIWCFPLVLLVPGENGGRVRGTFLLTALLVQAGHPWLAGISGIDYPPTWFGWTLQAARVVCLARIFWFTLQVRYVSVNARSNTSSDVEEHPTHAGDFALVG